VVAAAQTPCCGYSSCARADDRDLDIQASALLSGRSISNLFPLACSAT